MSDASYWIFGYGSLVWRPAFPHLRRCSATIDGYARRFWQGSTDHRGLPERPGRVVTLVPDDHASLSRAEEGFAPAPCWGTAYEVPHTELDDVLSRLDHRERGGYERVEIEIQLNEPFVAEPPEGARGRQPHTQSRSVTGLVYIASTENENFLGPASIEAIARQIHGAHGPSGDNPEYVTELAGSLRRMQARDDHVFAVEQALGRLREGGDP